MRCTIEIELSGCSSENFAPEDFLSTELWYRNLKTSYHYQTVMVGAVILEQQKNKLKRFNFVTILDIETHTLNNIKESG